MCVFRKGCGGPQSCCWCVKGRCAKISKVIEGKEKDLGLWGGKISGSVVSARPSLWKSQLHRVSLETSLFQPSWLPKPEWENLKTIAFLWVYSFLWSCCQNSLLWVFLTGMLRTWPKSSQPRSSFQSRKDVTVFHSPCFCICLQERRKHPTLSFPSWRYF